MKLNLLAMVLATTALLVAYPPRTVCAAIPPMPSEATVLIERATDDSAGFIVISNSANEIWNLETSTNLLDWSPAGSVKVFNGHARRALPDAATQPGMFFRAFRDPAAPDVPNDITNALLLPEIPFNYAAPAVPASFLAALNPGQDNMPSNNVTTDAGATLGRVLFYDKRLSTNQTVSCSSCHEQAHGFSDSRPFSIGFNGGFTGRNSMGLNNARWYLSGHFFWDERASTLEDQTLQPIQNSVEMGMNLATLTNRLAAEPFYTNLFANAFGSPDITPDRISKALAQFVRSIVATQTKFDIGMTNGFANFTDLERQGRLLFSSPSVACSVCHNSANFAGNTVLNNGLEFPYVDLGVGGITGNPQDYGKFKAPPLRNIALTAPYMHDGRFTNLEQVVDFYTTGVVDNANLSFPLRLGNGGVRRPILTQQQKDSLVAFLRTLTDETIATDPKFSDPFNYGD